MFVVVIPFSTALMDRYNHTPSLSASIRAVLPVALGMCIHSGTPRRFNIGALLGVPGRKPSPGGRLAGRGIV